VLQNQKKKKTNSVELFCYGQSSKTNKKLPLDKNYFAATSSADLCHTPKLETIVQADETIKQQQGYEK
jgi:hypothetical protein